MDERKPLPHGHLLAGEEAFVLERRADDSVWYGGAV
jgi:uncharacterized protein (UPF0548 family)